ncbi:MAG: hypothetical protein Q9170_007187 [Blastenia crenularia]
MKNGPGSTVTGRVCLVVTEPLDIDHLAITLSGRVQTDIDQSTQKAPGCVFQAQRVLFATKRTLIKDHVQVQEPCNWEFKFCIPDRCTAQENLRLRRWDRFDSGPKQQLPPAFASSYTNSDKINAANAAIIYELRATIVAKEIKIGATEPLDFTTTRSIEQSDIVPTVAHAESALRSVRLPQDGRRKSLLGSQTLRYAVSSKTPPFAAFQLVLQGSRQGIIGQPFQLQLSIKHDESTSAPASKPKVYLQYLNIQLQAHTSIRCTGSRCFKAGCLSIHKGEEFEDWDEELIVDSCDMTRLEAGSKRSIIKTSESMGLKVPDDTTLPGLDLD